MQSAGGYGNNAKRFQEICRIHTVTCSTYTHTYTHVNCRRVWNLHTYIHMQYIHAYIHACKLQEGMEIMQKDFKKFAEERVVIKPTARMHISEFVTEFRQFNPRCVNLSLSCMYVCMYVFSLGSPTQGVRISLSHVCMYVCMYLV